MTSGNELWQLAPSCVPPQVSLAAFAGYYSKSDVAFPACPIDTRPPTEMAKQPTLSAPGEGEMWADNCAQEMGLDWGLRQWGKSASGQW
eukprot:CAMPEP_0174335500 /NCGR_PEP_ID=MMETSP0810-20121108/20836_1 /TAXON_ID=73025 ORGANISM="Eutreptiella gymnastica-like, Strain CCMP1594" /NCGR_SAMPLE_ID=MMETSP0810 /ASSEMBLY_ACC=CAM_ASM_000659 /LENGTH=88 /DNA_ID=CAMNT_0015453923 /DNA_START=61 /DNA_END=325 /DNA_ORIENTATION=-